ncbi:MAG TPA: ABC transporter permease [Actinobacteria bacterium]|nr:ABC transporter permease [Actinomycetota bacterium]
MAKSLRILNENAIYFIMVAIFVFFAITLADKGFLSASNIMNILKQTSVISILAVGFTFVLASGEMDLSVGSTLAFSALIAALMLQRYGIVVAVLTSLAVGSLIGVLNGLLVVKVRMPSFLATIATQGIVYGAARWITNMQAVPVLNDRFTTIFGQGSLGALPVLFIWTILIAIIGHVIMNNTPFGRKVLATGGNKIAATFSGINTGNVKILLFTAMGFIAALSGMLYTGRLAAARYNYGESDLFTVVAAVIVGGNSIYGGKGKIVGTLIGSIILGLINNGLIIFGANVDQQIIFRGVIILIAVALSPKE